MNQPLETPILYNFRRCPYAMRARLALHVAGIKVEVREIMLRSKPDHMLEISPKGTVPVLWLGDRVIDESRDIMEWALAQNDPDDWCNMPHQGEDWIKQIEGPFKSALDKYKYATRYENVDATKERDRARDILMHAETLLCHSKWLFGDLPCLADMATITFVRQYANVDRDWFDAQPWANLRAWLDQFLASDRFAAIMLKYPLWQPSNPILHFP
ncbi:glutathione S-transferase [Pacificibacter maritimus]|uniref:Glutathione S-transferase n=1 Tax=Pacificibacter maritimus TaxID=762213 RepID=A0A3N4U8V0_9RHOB|nr:glutathione S-transferase [Pacificibacter maritimus]RPE64785.1 glutathione S-transferase [Pacificibacter maritimus]